MNSSIRVLRNAMVRVFGLVFVGGFIFLAHILIARHLGVAEFGLFSFILAFVTIFRLIVDMGLRNILIREISRNKARLGELLGSARLLLWILSALSFVLIAVIVNLVTLSEKVVTSTYIAGIAVIVAFQGLNYGAVCRAYEDMGLDVAGSIVQSGSFLILIVLGISKNIGLKGIFLALLISNIISWIYYYGVVRIKYLRGRMNPDMKVCRYLFRESFALGVGEVTRKMVWNVDKLLLAWLSSAVSVGIFSSAYKIIEGINPVSMNLTVSLFPVFSRIAVTSRERLKDAYEKSMKFMGILGFPLAATVLVLSDRIINLLFGQTFMPAAPVLRIISVVIILLFMSSMNAFIFTSLNKQHFYILNSALCLGINIAADLLLIPRYHYMGAAVGTLIAEIAFFYSGILFLRRYGISISPLRIMWKPFAGSFFLALFLYLISASPLPWLLSGIAAGFFLYLCIIFLLKTFTNEEIIMIKQSIKLRTVSP